MGSWSGLYSKNHGSLAGGISRGFAARDGSAVKSQSTSLQRLRRQISLDYYTIPPATQAIRGTEKRLHRVKRTGFNDSPFPPVNLEFLFPKNFRCSSAFQWRRTGNHLPFSWWKVLFTFFFLSITVAATVTGTMIVIGLVDSVARTFCPSLANDIYTRRVLWSLELAFLRPPTATWSTFSHFFTLLLFAQSRHLHLRGSHSLLFNTQGQRDLLVVAALQDNWSLDFTCLPQ